MMKITFDDRLRANCLFALIIGGGLIFSVDYLVARSRQKGNEPTAAAGERREVAGVPKGTYLQAVTTDRAGADSAAAFYRKQGLPAVITAGASPRAFDVLIGPFGTGDAIADAQSRLKKAGMKHSVLRQF